MFVKLRIRHYAWRILHANKVTLHSEYWRNLFSMFYNFIVHIKRHHYSNWRYWYHSKDTSSCIGYKSIWWNGKYRNLDHVFKCGKSFLAEIKKRLEAKTKSGISISPHFYNNLLFEKKNNNKNKNRCLERHEVPNLY